MQQLVGWLQQPTPGGLWRLDELPIRKLQESSVSLASSLQSAAIRFPNKPAVVLGSRVLTYAELNREAQRLAQRLMASGAMPGDRVAVHLYNGADLVIGYFGCFYAGMIAVPVNTRMKGPEIQFVLEHSGSAIYVGERDLFSEVESIRSNLPGIRQFMVDLCNFDPPDGRAPASALPWVPLDHPAVILYTSGSTSRPKGVVHTHRSSMVAAQGLRIGDDDMVLIITPMVHSAAFMMLLAGIAAATTLVVVSHFEPDLVLDAIARHHVTYLLGMPVMYRALIASQETRPRDVSSLKWCVAGGDAVPQALQSEFARCFGLPLREIFGATETGLIAGNWPGIVDPVGSFGRAAPGVDIAIMDARGCAVSFGTEGEMCVRSAALMMGYWNDQSATEAALTGGWFRTGDLACQDRNGYLWFRGRKKEIIVRGGSNVSPQEVEAILYRHPAVREVGVVGVPDTVWGQRVVAFVSPHYRVAAKDLIAFVSKYLAGYKVPEEILFLDDLKKNSTGKIDRRALRERYVEVGAKLEAPSTAARPPA
jgi:long-chain acyl-CoA synthetase